MSLDAYQQVAGYLAAHDVTTSCLVDAMALIRRAVDGADVPFRELVAAERRLRDARADIDGSDTLLKGNVDHTDYIYWRVTFWRRTYDAVISLLVGVMVGNAVDVQRVDDALRTGHLAWRMRALTKRTDIRFSRPQNITYIAKKRSEIRQLIDRDWVAGKSIGEVS